MTLPREQVADLQPGDVVEVVHEDWPEGTVVRGPLWLDSETLQVGRIVIRHWDGRHPYDTGLTLTVVSRAPRPLYVNHPRTEPVPGDVVRDEEADLALIVLRVAGQRFPDKWIDQYGTERTYEHLSPSRRLLLLVDGETGQAVP